MLLPVIEPLCQSRHQHSTRWAYEVLLQLICKQKWLFFFSILSFSLRAFSNSGPRSFFFFGREQCCLFEFSSLAVIPRHSLRFINSMPYPMGDPLHPFMLALMTLVLPFVSALMILVLKEIPFTSLTQNIPSLSLSSLCLLPQTLSPTYSDKPFHHDAGERPRFFPP